jgi:CelD/BcsL family acetyltransferase involved in cellulose biosynthesis
MGDGSGDSDNLELLVRPGHEEAVVTALLHWLRSQAHLWDFCEFNTMPGNSPAAKALTSYLKVGWRGFNYQRPWSVVTLPETWELYLRQLSSEDRNNLGRYLRRLEKRHQVRFYKCTQEAELNAGLEVLFRLHQERWKIRGEPGSFGCDARRRFYNEMGRLLLARKRLEFWLLDLEGTPVAAQFAMRYGDTVFQLQEGFNPKHTSDRVGYLLRGHVMRQLIADGVRRYDFLAGETAHKSRWGSEVGTYINVHFARRHSRGGLYLLMVHNLGEVKKWLRAHLPRQAWKILHSVNCMLRGIPAQQQGSIDQPSADISSR